MSFKEVVFVKIKKEQLRQSLQKRKQQQSSQFSQALKAIMKWSFYCEKRVIREKLLTNEGKGIYSNGVVIRERPNGSYSVETITSIPFEKSAGTYGTEFVQERNFVNYKFEGANSQSDPTSLYENLGYKLMENLTFVDVECFGSLTLGLEVHIYSKTGYVQFRETSPTEIRAANSSIKVVLSKLGRFLDAKEVVNLLINKMKPGDLCEF